MTYVRKMPVRSKKPWTVEEVAELRKLYDEKEPVSTIAYKLSRTTKAVQAALVKFDIEKRLQSQIRFEKPHAVVKPRLVDYDKPRKGTVALLYAKPNQCRWPVGLNKKDTNKGSGHFVCGCKTVSYGLPYCEKHMREAYQEGTAQDLTGLGDKFK